MDMITLAMAKAYSDSKGGYTEKETKKIEVFPQTTAFFLLGSTGSIFKIPLTEGKEYVVVFEGVEYKCIAHSVIDKTSNYKATYLGNAKLVNVNYPYTEEPFLVLTNDTFNDTDILTSFEDGNYTIEIYQTEEVETIHPIDPKYFVNVVDLTQYVLSGDSEGTHHGETLNDVCLQKLQVSLQNGGTMAYLGVGLNSAFSEACNGANQVCVKIDMGYDYVLIPVSANKTEQIMKQMSASVIMYLEAIKGLVEVKVLFKRVTETYWNTYIQATPIAV